MRVRGRYLVGALLLGLSTMGGAWAQTLSFVGDLASTRAFMEDLASLYQARGRGEITIALATATEALQRAGSGEIDMGGSARSGRPTDRQESRASMYPIVWDALVVIVNRDNPIINISVEQLYDVYTGQITNWSQLGGDDNPIEIVAHEDPLHGVDHNVAELLLGNSRAELPATHRVPHMEALGEMVRDTPWSLAIASYSTARKMPVKILSLEGRSPGFDTIQSGDYVLYTPMYLAVRDGGPNRREIRNFLKFASTSEAKRILRRNGVVPYADGLALVSRQLDRAELLDRVRRSD